MLRDECPLCGLLIDVVRKSNHLTTMERIGLEKLLTSPMFGAREVSIEAILQDFLVRVNTDPRATARIEACGLGRALANPW
jgi:hypothetical protein